MPRRALYTTDINEKNYYGCALDLNRTDKRHHTLYKQREDRGFDDSETWCLRSAVLQFTLPRLRRFKEVCAAHPADITEQRWDEMLAEMIWAIEIVLADEGWECGSRATAEQKAHQDRVLAGMKLFHDRFMDLWW